MEQGVYRGSFGHLPLERAQIIQRSNQWKLTIHRGVKSPVG